MGLLLLALCGPMQSWGSRSRFTERDTEREPTKSGVVGLLAAAMGRRRGEALDDLAALRMGVRVDWEGTLLRDFHTALNVARADGSGPAKQAVLSNRYYLSDALFLVGLQGDADLLERAEQALSAPCWPLALGRRSCPPSAPLIPPTEWDREGELAGELTHYPWLVDLPPYARAIRRWEKPDELRMVLEAEGEDEVHERRADVPLDFAQRTFDLRGVRHCFIPVPEREVEDASQSA